MDNNNKHNIRYTDEQLAHIALKHGSRQSFAKIDKGAYEAAARRKILDKICAHMTPKVYFMEETCRAYFESIFNEKFPNVRPEWLINPKTGQKLELDGYCEKLNLAFEYNGRHHFDNDHINFDPKIIERDSFKRKMCKLKNIKLIVLTSDNLRELKKEIKTKLNLNYELPEIILKTKGLLKLQSYSSKEFLSLPKNKQSQIIQSYHQQGASMPYIMTLCNVSERTAYRRLNNQ